MLCKVLGHLEERVACNLIQQLAVDVNEVALDVHAQDVGFALIVVGTLANLMGKTLYAEVRAASFDAAVGVVNKGALKQCVGHIVYEVMDYAVTVVCGIYLSRLGKGNKKACGWQWLVSPVIEVVTQLVKVCFKVLLKFGYIRLGGLVLPRAVVRYE